MIGIGIGVNRQRFRGGGGGFDADYQAVLDYATTQGYTLPSASQQILQNQLMLDLKAAGVWSKLDTFAVFATDGNSDFALINWVTKNGAIAVNSPSFTTNKGYAGNGTSSYVENDIALNAGVNFTQNDASIFRVIDTDASQSFNSTYCRSRSPLTSVAVINAKTNVSSDNYLNSGFTASFINEPIVTKVVQHLKRTSSTNLEFWLNGIKKMTTSVSSNGVPNTKPFLVGGYNNDPGLTAPHDALVSISGHGQSLNGLEGPLNSILKSYIAAL